ncbi:MAG: hypothetical protein JWN70_4331, partial [Planctomycetaceae bacterium]|nr:hypothetical protein [Planctomycetaceae bacterium]
TEGHEGNEEDCGNTVDGAFTSTFMWLEEADGRAWRPVLQNLVLPSNLLLKYADREFVLTYSGARSL